MNNQKNTAHIANGVLGHIGEVGKGNYRARDLIVVTVVSPANQIQGRVADEWHH
jgi:hypothetical protein